MGVLKFDDVDDRLRFSTLASALGNLPTGAWTAAVLLRRETATTFDALTYLLSGGTTAAAGVSITDADRARIDTVEAPETAAGIFTNTAVPVLLVATKAAGTVTPRFHYKIDTGGTWVHVNGSTTMANKSAGTVLDIGTWQGTGDPFDGWIGLVGYWSGAMSDGNVELLGDSWRTTDFWFSPHGTPVFLAELNVAASAVVDLAGNATALTNTGPALDAGETLGSWNFDGDGGAVLVPGTTTRGKLWHQPGLIFYDIARINSQRDQILDMAKEAHFGWVALQACNGQGGSPVTVFQDYIPGWRDAALARGMEFGIWTVLGPSPSADATAASSQIELHGATFYIADAEDDYKTDAGGTRANAATFTAAFRALQPGIKSAWTTYGAAAGDNLLGDATNSAAGVMDFKSWLDAGFDVLPQAYPNQDAIYEPNLCTRHWARANWPVDRVHLMIGMYDPADLIGPGTFRGSDYVTKLAATAANIPGSGKACAPDTAYGFSVFLGDCMEQVDFDALMEAMFEQFCRDPRRPASYRDTVWSR